MPGSYVARVNLVAGVTTDDVTATIGGVAMTARDDKTGFFMSVAAAEVDAVVTRTETKTEDVAVPGGTLQGVVASTEMQTIMPGSHVARVHLAAGVTTDDVTATIGGVAMTARADKTGFFMSVNTETATAAVTSTTILLVETVTIK